MHRRPNPPITETEAYASGLNSWQLSDLYAGCWWAMCEAMRAGDRDRQAILLDQALAFQRAGRRVSRDEDRAARLGAVA